LFVFSTATFFRFLEICIALWQGVWHLEHVESENPMNTTQANALRDRLDAALTELAPLIQDKDIETRSWDLGPKNVPPHAERSARDRVARCRQHALPISSRDAVSVRAALEDALTNRRDMAPNPASIVRGIEDLACSVREMRIY